MRQDKRKRHEEQSLPRRRDDACPQRHGNVLQQHIAHNDKAGDRERDALQPQRQRTAPVGGRPSNNLNPGRPSGDATKRSCLYD